MAGRFYQHKERIQHLCEKAWKIHDQQTDLTGFVESYPDRVTNIKAQLEALSESFPPELHVPQEMQSMATQQLHLSSELQSLKSKWHQRSDLQQEIHLQMESLMQQLEGICQSFVGDLCGLTHRTVRLENDGDLLEIEISSREFGQMHFPLLHALFKVTPLWITPLIEA